MQYLQRPRCSNTDFSAECCRDAGHAAAALLTLLRDRPRPRQAGRTACAPSSAIVVSRFSDIQTSSRAKLPTVVSKIGEEVRTEMHES